MALERFIPKSPDMFIRNSQDFEVAKFGHLNTIVEYINNNTVQPAGLNGYVQFNDNNALGGDAGLFWDNINKNLGIGTTNATARLRVISADTNGIAEFFQNGLASSPLHITRYSGLVGINLNTAAGGSASPVPVGDNIQMSRITTNTYNGTAFGVSARIEVFTKGIQSATNYGSVMRFLTTPENNINTNEVLSLLSDGNVQIGVSYATPLGAKLGIKGSGSTSATTSLLVQNSLGSASFRVYDDAIVSIPYRVETPFIRNSSGNLVLFAGNYEVEIQSINPTLGNGSLRTTGQITTTDNQTKSIINVNNLVPSTSASFSTLNGFAFTSTITQTTGTIRGLYINPTLTASTDFRAIEATSGNVLIGVTPSNTAKLSIKGSGSTSATTSLLVQNSSSDTSLEVKDDGQLRIPVKSAQNINNLLIDASSSGTTATARIALIAQGFNAQFYISACGSASTGAPSAIVSKGLLQCPSGIAFTTNNAGAIANTDISLLLYQSKSVHINGFTEVASAVLNVESTTKGFLPPRMTTVQRDAIVTPATGLKVYNTSTNTTDTYDGTTWQRFGQQTLIKGSGSTFATNSLLVQNSLGTEQFYVRDDNAVGSVNSKLDFTNSSVGHRIGNLTITGGNIVTSGGLQFGAASGFAIFASPILAVYFQPETEILLQSFLPSNTTRNGLIFNNPWTNAGASGTSVGNIMKFNNSLGTSIGNVTLNMCSVTNTVNTTAGTTLQRGFYYNPTLTGTVGFTHNAIETVTGDVLLNTTSGNTLIGVTPSNTAKLSIKGSGSTSATTSLLVQNSLGTQLLNLRDDASLQLGSGSVTLVNTANLAGRLTITRGTTNDICLNLITQGSGGVVFQGSQYLNYSANEAIVMQQNGGGFGIGSAGVPTELCELERSYSGTTSTSNASLLIKPSIVKSGGVSTVNFAEIRPILNAAGGATTTRGLYYNPTLTNITNITHYGIQTTSGGAYINTATPNASAALQADSTTQGFLPPRMTTAQKVTLAATAAAGLMIYDTNLNKLCVYTGAGWETITSI